MLCSEELETLKHAYQTDLRVSSVTVTEANRKPNGFYTGIMVSTKEVDSNFYPIGLNGLIFGRDDENL